MTFSLITLILVSLAIVALIRPIWRAVVPPRNLVKEASCGSCGYPVRGLAGERCPECGADLHDVGIVTPRLQMRARGSLTVAIVCWIVLIMLIGAVCAPLLLRATPPSLGGMSYKQTRTLGSPRSRLYDGVRIAADSVVQGHGVSGTIDITLTLGDGTERSIRTEAPTLDLVEPATIGDSDQPHRSITPEAIEAWFLQSGIVTDSEEVRIEADTVARCAASMAASPMTAGGGSAGFSSSSTSITSTPAGGTSWSAARRLIAALAALALVGAMIGGAAFIARRYRSLLADSDSAQGA